MSGASGRFLDDLRRGLEERRRLGLLRTLDLPSGVDLASNDYLGYAGDPALAERVAAAVRAHGVGPGSARLLHGDRAVFREAEERLAALCAREAALLFSSGYAACVGLLSCLVGPGDTVYSDAANHASLIDGMRLSGAARVVFPHGDREALGRALREGGGRRLVVTESVFSADGDESDLRSLADLAEENGAAVVVDEAHATGLYGARRSGRVEEAGLSARVLATVHTGGKALGVAGAWVAGDRVLVEHLVNHARSFVFSTAPMPALAAGLIASLDRLAADADGPPAVHRKAALLRRLLREEGIAAGGSSAILPIPVGDDGRAVALRDALRADGFAVGALRPPTVPRGTARLRVCARAPVPEADLERFVERLAFHRRSPR